MTFLIRTARATVLCAAAAVAVAAPALAFAQQTTPYAGQSQGEYQSCKQRKDGNTVAGVVIGGILGAVVGSQVSGHGARTEGSVIGAGGGALVGGAIGADATKCDEPTLRRQAQEDDNGPRTDGGDYGNGRRADDGRADDGRSDNSRGYQDQGGGYADQRYDDDRAPSYGHAYPVRHEPDGDDCGMADSTLHMPDGTVQERYIHVCRDLNGRYQVVE